MANESYNGDYSEVPELMGKLGITLDNSPEDRGRFEALQQLLAIYGHYRGTDPKAPLDDEDAQEFLVG
jgi:hypothetical protein